MTEKTRRVGATAIVGGLALLAALAVAGFHLIGTYLPTIFSATTLRTSTDAVHDRYVSLPTELLETDVPRYRWAGGEILLNADEDDARRRSLNCMLRPEDGSESVWISLEHTPEHGDTLVYRGTPEVSAPAQMSCVNDAREQVRVYTGADIDRAAVVNDRWWTISVAGQAFGAAVLVFGVGLLIVRARRASSTRGA